MQKVVNEYKGVILLFLAFVFLTNSMCASLKITEDKNTNQVTYYEK